MPSTATNTLAISSLPPPVQPRSLSTKGHYDDALFSASTAESSYRSHVYLYDAMNYHHLEHLKLPPVTRSPRSASLATRPHYTRSLTVSTDFALSPSSSSDSDPSAADMATDIASPGSPPELSSSRSSAKSSSLRSSSLPGEGDEDMTHFEDIALSAEPQRMTPPSPLDRPHKPRPLLRTSTTPTPRTSQPPTHVRDASHGLRTSVTVKNGMRNLQDQRSPVQAHGFTAVSRPSLAVPPKQTRRRHHSPGRRLPPSPRAAARPTSSRAPSEGGPTLPLRRSPSQQGRRKSAKEIEAEFDAADDADDEVPEDAIITNIPISPRPPPTRSASASPDRAPSPPYSAGVVEFGRARSWDTALSGLSHEVRDLTLKLESHAGYLTRRNSAEAPYPRSSPPSPPRPTLHHSRSTTWNMPPVQKGNPLVDPLPVSKEKEKHLTRTRPSWLPPKSKREEQKHLKEYKLMMESFVEAEKRKSAEAEKTKARRSSKERELDEALRAWRHILGDWDQALQGSAARARWWHGIPPALRGQVWARAIGNELHLSAASFHAALQRATRMEQRLRDVPAARAAPAAHARQASASETPADQRARRSLAALEKDIATGAFPDMALFQPGQPRYASLRHLLLAYAAYREDTGHVRGTAGIAALLLLQHMPVSSTVESPDADAPARERDTSPPLSQETRDRDVSDAATAGAFIAFANLLNRPLSLNYCINDAAAKERTVRHVATTLNAKCPRLAAHFATLGDGALAEVVTPLAQSLLTNVLSAPDAARLLDVLAFEGDGVVVRAIVAVLGRCEGQLYCSRGELGALLGWPAAAGTSRGGNGGGHRTGGDEDSAWVSWIRWAGREDAPAPR